MATWVKTGTVSVTLNSTTVNGVGTSFTVEGRVGDGFVGPDERLYEVANIVSDTQLTLGKAYKGATASAQPYAMIPIQGYLQRSADALRMYSEEAKDLVESPTITALAAAVMGVNKMLYWTGAGSLATIDSTAFGRSLLALANAGALKTAAGLNNVDNTSDANKPVSTATQTALNAKQAAHANLTALSALTLAANKLPYATSANAMALADFTAFARTLLDDADAAAMRATLGLGTAALVDITTSTTDATPGRLLRVQDFGIGAEAVPNINDFANNIGSGVYYSFTQGHPSATPNGPPASSSGAMSVLALGGLSSSYKAFLAIQNNSNGSGQKTYVGAKGAAGAPTWREVYTNVSLLGAVSQSGGVPTGAVIERGSNSNGEYVRYADGTQICWGVASEALLCTAVVGNGFQSPGTSNFIFPIGFASPPRVSPGGSFPSGGASRAWPNMAVVGSGSCTIVAHGFASNATIQVAYIAVGRWY